MWSLWTERSVVPASHSCLLQGTHPLPFRQGPAPGPCVSPAGIPVAMTGGSAAAEAFTPCQSPPGLSGEQHWGMEAGVCLCGVCTPASECECLTFTSTASLGRETEKEKGGTGAPGNQNTSGQEPKRKGPDDSLQTSYLCPGTAWPLSLHLSINSVVCVWLPYGPEEQRKDKEGTCFSLDVQSQALCGHGTYIDHPESWCITGTFIWQLALRVQPACSDAPAIRWQTGPFPTSPPQHLSQMAPQLQVKGQRLWDTIPGPLCKEKCGGDSCFLLNKGISFHSLHLLFISKGNVRNQKCKEQLGYFRMINETH